MATIFSGLYDDFIVTNYDFQVEFAQGFKIISNICAGGSIVPNYSKCLVGELV